MVCASNSSPPLRQAGSVNQQVGQADENETHARRANRGEEGALPEFGRIHVERLTAAGFIVDQLGIEYFGQETFRRAGIAANSVLYVVRKEAVSGNAAPAVPTPKYL